MTTIGIFLFPGVEELDFVGPWEVLRAWERVFPGDGQHVVLLSREEGVITCAMGLRVVPDLTWRTAPPLDVLVYPGGPSCARALDRLDARIEELHQHDVGGQRSTSCPGARLPPLGLCSTAAWSSPP